MGWYSQGTQVVDFTENAERHGRLQGGRLLHPGQREPVGLAHLQGRPQRRRHASPTTAPRADFALGSAGRNAVEVYKATLPAPPTPRGRLAGTGAGLPAHAVPGQQGQDRAQEHRQAEAGPGQEGHRPPRRPAAGHDLAQDAHLPLLREEEQEGARRRGVRPQGPDPDRGHQPRQPPLRQDQAGHARQDAAQALRQAPAQARRRPRAWCARGAAWWCSACAGARSATSPWPTAPWAARASRCAAT